MLVTTCTGCTLRINPQTVYHNTNVQYGEQFAEVLAVSENHELVTLYMGWGKAAVRHAVAMVAGIKN